MDYGHAETDRKLKELEKTIAKEYAQAEKEVQAKLDDYLRRYKVKDEIKRKKLAAGEITRKEYNDWRTGQIMIGKRWEEMRDTLAEDLKNTNKIANSMARKFSYEAYALNHNYGTFEVEKGSLVDTSYTLYSADSVERLVRDNPEVLPPPGKKTSQRIREGKDVLWNKQQIQSVMTQSILQGESIPQIAERLAVAVGEKNKNAAIRNARTMTTFASNAGRDDAYRRAAKMGVKSKKIWVAILDNRTRHSHRAMDGEEQEVQADGEVLFSNNMRCPGDPSGPPEEVYNCRCRLISAPEGSDIAKYGINPEQGGVTRRSYLRDVSYEEWKKGKNGSKVYGH